MPSPPPSPAPPVFTWGGARKGAGRKPNGPVAGESHLRRPDFDPKQPVLVTLKVRPEVPSLRAPAAMAEMRAAFAASERFGFRVAHYAVQAKRLDLIVEAEGNESLAKGMQGLSIRIARSVNRAMGRSGSFWADRYHARGLATPLEVRRALVSVLVGRQRRGTGNVDPCSSAAAFDGWVAGFTPVAGRGAPGTARARTWLLTRAWRRLGAIDPTESPDDR